MEYRLLASLDPAVQREVLMSSTRHRYSRGEVLFHEGDPGDSLHLVAKGRVAVRVGTPDGDTATLTIMGAGATFGEQALIDATARRTATVAAIEPTETMMLRRADFESLRRQHPTVDRFLVEQLAAWVRRLTTQLTEALYLGVDKRIMRRMVELHEVFDGDVVPVTQEDVATMAGTTRPTVNRVMQILVEDGVIELGRGRFMVADRNALEHRAR